MPSVQSFPSSLFLPSVNAPRIYLTLSLDQEKTSTIFAHHCPQLWSCLAWYHSSIFKQLSHQSHAQNSTSTITWARDFDLNIAHSKASLDRLHFITITRVTLPKIGHLQALLTGGGLPLILLTPNLWMLSPSKKSLLKNHTTPAKGAQSPGQSEPKAKHDHSDQHKAHRQKSWTRSTTGSTTCTGLMSNALVLSKPIQNGAVNICQRQPVSFAALVQAPSKCLCSSPF